MTTLKLKILKNGKQTHGASSDQFESLEAFEAWKQQCIDNNVWGMSERWLVDSVQTPLSEEDKAKAIETRIVEVYPRIPEYIDEQGNVIPEVHAVTVTEYKFAAEYSIDVKDITAEVQAEKQAKEAKRLAKEKRKDERKKLDWNKINTVAELKAIVKNLVENLED